MLTDVIKLLIKIHKYSMNYFDKHAEETQADKKKFEVDIEFFSNWFKI